MPGARAGAHPADGRGPAGLRACRRLGAAALVALVLAALTPLPRWVAARYRVPARLGPADAIVVLGGGFAYGALGDPSLQRLAEGIRLQRLGLAPLLVLSGEGSRRGEPSELGARTRVARDLGVPPDVILTVDANTTREEAQGTARLLRPRGVRSVLLISGSLHLVRARAVFEREGFQVRPAPADRSFFAGSAAGERLALTHSLLRELAGWWYYRLAGYL